MVKDIYESICRGEDVRANLICLKQLIADKKEKSAFAYMLAGDFRKLAALLKDKDAKIRKNAALILGENWNPKMFFRGSTKPMRKKNSSLSESLI